MRSAPQIKRLLAPITLLLLALALALSIFLERETKPVVKLGVLNSLTGTMAASETPLLDAIRMAVEEANQRGGVNGARIEMIVADCKSDAAYCATQAEKLLTADKVDALIGCWTSACRKAVKTVVERHHSLLLYPVQYEGLEQSPDILYLGAAPNQQVIPMVNWALQNFGGRAYLVGSDYVFPHAANQIVKRLLLAKGGKWVAERYEPLGQRNLDSVASEIAALRPDFVVNTLNGDSNQYFFRALRQAGIGSGKIPVFSTSIAEAEVAAMGPDLIVGNYSAWNYFQSIHSELNRDFVERFQRRFGNNQVVDDPMEAAYIGVKLWVNSLEGAGTHDLRTVKTVLSQQTLSAPEGIVAVDAATMHLWKQVRIGRVRADGQFEIVWQSGKSMAPAPFPFFISRNQLPPTQ